MRKINVLPAYKWCSVVFIFFYFVFVYWTLDSFWKIAEAIFGAEIYRTSRLEERFRNNGKCVFCNITINHDANRLMFWGMENDTDIIVWGVICAQSKMLSLQKLHTSSEYKYIYIYIYIYICIETVSTRKTLLETSSLRICLYCQHPEVIMRSNGSVEEKHRSLRK